MDEDGIPEHDGSRPGKSRRFLLGGLVIALVLLVGGGWLISTKLGLLKGASEAEQVHREATLEEKSARQPGPLQGLPSGIEGPERPPSLSITVQGMSVDQLSVLVLESGERRVQGRVYNQGRQPLTAARVDIQFLSSGGEVMLSRPVNPLVVSGGIFGDQSEPLATGSGRYFLVSTDDIPPGWSGKLDARIREVQFGGQIPVEVAQP
ncbi:MAG: hypothetical protein HQL99_00630 [Magnetococcales bacterium]|nr:hypothetical protein [Magnetococcales bacterium]